MPSIGAPELLVIIVLALIIFGPRRLPEIGRTVGKGMREFRRAASEIRSEISQELDEEPPARRTRSRSAPKETPGDGEPKS
jgi:sec-independent protein translocase protein TatA